MEIILKFHNCRVVNLFWPTFWLTSRNICNILHWSAFIYFFQIKVFIDYFMISSVVICWVKNCYYFSKLNISEKHFFRVSQKKCWARIKRNFFFVKPCSLIKTFLYENRILRTCAFLHTVYDGKYFYIIMGVLCALL